MIHVVKADITQQRVDAIVNAANSSLLGGGGVDGAIHRAAGPALLKACLEVRQTKGECATGEAVITIAGNLPSKYVIHAVGPVWQGGNYNESVLLENAYRNSLQLAVEHACRSVAFPTISTGAYGYPKKQAAEVAINTIHTFYLSYPVMEILFCCFDDENYRLMTGELDKFSLTG